jgi:hypothetical protein
MVSHLRSNLSERQLSERQLSERQLSERLLSERQLSERQLSERLLSERLLSERQLSEDFLLSKICMGGRGCRYGGGGWRYSYTREAEEVLRLKALIHSRG